MDTSRIQTAIPVLTQFALKAVGAIALWVVGRGADPLRRAPAGAKPEVSIRQTVAAYIGTAMSVLLNLSHLAAGVILLILPPFKVGDFISAGGMSASSSPA